MKASYIDYQRAFSWNFKPMKFYEYACTSTSNVCFGTKMCSNLNKIKLRSHFMRPMHKCFQRGNSRIESDRKRARERENGRKGVGMRIHYTPKITCIYNKHSVYLPNQIGIQMKSSNRSGRFHSVESTLRAKHARISQNLNIISVFIYGFFLLLLLLQVRFSQIQHSRNGCAVIQKVDTRFIFNIIFCESVCAVPSILFCSILSFSNFAYIIFLNSPFFLLCTCLRSHSTEQLFFFKA